MARLKSCDRNRRPAIPRKHVPVYAVYGPRAVPSPDPEGDKGELAGDEDNQPEEGGVSEAADNAAERFPGQAQRGDRLDRTGQGRYWSGNSTEFKNSRSAGRCSETRLESPAILKNQL